MAEEFTEEELTLPPCKYEYLDHTADVQLHAWGDSLKEAFEQCGIAMFGYMTELNSVEIKQSSEIEATGHDLESLLFHFLDELLFLFSCEPFLICSKITITEFITEGEEMKIKCKCYGEEFTLGKHPQGTEVKAITYSAMQIVNEPEKNKFEYNLKILLGDSSALRTRHYDDTMNERYNTRSYVQLAALAIWTGMLHPAEKSNRNVMPYYIGHFIEFLDHTISDNIDCKVKIINILYISGHQ